MTLLASDTYSAMPLKLVASSKYFLPYYSDAYLSKAGKSKKNADIFINVYNMSKYETHQIMKITPYGRYFSREY